MKAVFDVKPGSEYDDEITSRYHFPARRNYIEVATAAIGDWVLFRTTRRGGGRIAYVATARMTRVAPDLEGANHLYAHVSDFLAFPTPAPLANGRSWRILELYAGLGGPDIPARRLKTGHRSWSGLAPQTATKSSSSARWAERVEIVSSISFNRFRAV